jgi:hypothetical protein
MTFTTGNMLNFADYAMTYENGIIRIMKGGEFISKDDTLILAQIISGFLIEVIDNTELPKCS